MDLKVYQTTPFSNVFDQAGNGLGQALDARLLFPPRTQTVSQGAQKLADGTKPVVICGGVVTEVKDMTEAQAVAESQAHSKSADAYILKPVRKVAPKRDVVSTDLA